MWQFSVSDRTVVWDNVMSETLGAEPRVPETLDSWLETYLAQDSQSFSDALTELVADGLTAEVAFQAHRAGGTLVGVEAVQVPMLDDAGRACRVVGVNVNVTAERSAEAGMRASEERFRVLYEDSRTWSCRRAFRRLRQGRGAPAARGPVDPRSSG